MNPTRTRVSVAAAAAAAGLGLALANPWSASAGHENTVLETALDGRAEVGTSKAVAGDPNGRGEAYVFGIDNDPTTLCYVLTVDKIGSNVTGAHIHEGPKGANGPVVAFLAAPADGNAADCLTEGEPGKFADGQTVREILTNPSGYYVNVHTEKFPNGAIRGQLAPQR